MKHPLHKKDLEYRKFLKLKKERGDMWELMMKMPYREVEPFQHGWQVRIKINPNYAYISGLQEAINVGFRKYAHIYEVVDVKNIRKGIFGRWMHGNYKSYIPDAIAFTQSQYDAFSPKIKKFFYKDITKMTYFGVEVVRWKISFEHRWIKLHVKPNIFNMIQDLNPDAISRYQEISELIEQNCYYEKYGRSYGKRGFNCNLRQDFKNQLHKFNKGMNDSIEIPKYKRNWA
jgi:hypothetical protein